jgi:hypothetical protein
MQPRQARTQSRLARLFGLSDWIYPIERDKLHKRGFEKISP